MRLGALRTPPGQERGLSVHHLIGGNDDTIPEAWDLRGPWSRISDQHGESCFGHGFAQAFRTVSKGAIDPAAMGIYNIAQWLEDTSQKKLNDKGSYTHLVLDGLTKYGIVDRSRFDDYSDPTQVVPQDVFEAGSLAIVKNIYRIDELGDAKIFNIKRAIHQSHPVVFAMDIGKSYRRYKSGIWMGETEAIEGGHANCIVGYDDECAIAANSWDIDYGEEGYIRIGWKVFRDIFATYDFQIVTTNPGVLL